MCGTYQKHEGPSPRHVRDLAQAVHVLDVPWREDEARGRLSAKRERAVEAYLRRKERGLDDFDPDWEAGELNVRMVLVGDPASRVLAKKPPAWARCGPWLGSDRIRIRVDVHGLISILL